VTDEHTAILRPRELGLGITPERNVSLRLGKPDVGLGFDPEISLAAELTPGQARQLAAALIRKADEAEGASGPGALS
jgi:hypothetical protein